MLLDDVSTHPKNFAPLVAVAVKAIPSVRETPSLIVPDVTASPSAVTLPYAESYSNITLDDSLTAVKLKLLNVNIAFLSPNPLFDCNVN